MKRVKAVSSPSSVRTFSVSFRLTDDQITDLGNYLKIRQLSVSAEMDVVHIEDRICMAVFKAALPALASSERRT